MHINTQGRNYSFCPEGPVSGGRSYTAFSTDKEHTQRLSLSHARMVSHPFPAEDPGGLPVHRAQQNPVLQREPGCRHMEPRWNPPPPPSLAHLREAARIKMRAVVFAAVGALLLSPASCQSGKRFSYDVGWDCYFVSQESTESNLFYISHKLHPQRQRGILVIKRGNHGREEM